MHITRNAALASILNESDMSSGARVRSALQLQGKTIKQMSADLGKSSTHVSLVIHGHRDSHLLRSKIADYIGVCIGDIWPEFTNEKKAALESEDQAHEAA